jgi:putative inorganic carbon (HCO3(-)) transporter
MNSELTFSFRQIAVITAISIAIVASAFATDYYFLLLLPFFFFISVGFVFKPDSLFFLLAFITPLSINPFDAELGKLSLSLPSEPLAAILVLFFFLVLLTTNRVDKKFLLHPISILLYIYFAWSLICCLTSVDKLVSIKFIIAKLWFIVPCYFLASVFFKEKKNILHFLFLFVIGMTIISIYNLGHLSMYGFEDKPSQWTMLPFFKDHTILGAVLGLTIPVSIGLVKLHSENAFRKFILFFSTIILILCLIFTYSRAAWSSMIPVILLYLVFIFKIKFKWVMLFVGLILFYLISNIEPIIMELERNKIAGSDDLVENAESITNITTDPSNLERINRWASAIEMWKEKPFFGYGPGTYMFEYAPFQLGRNYTSISTNFGDVGNAHSEYLGPLAETGIIGMLIFLALFVMTFYYAFQTYYQSVNRFDRILIATVSCGLISYFYHGFLNNFLDTDKASNIFWPCIAVIVVLNTSIRMKELKNEGIKAV